MEHLHRIHPALARPAGVRWGLALLLCVATTALTRADTPPIVDIGTLGGSWAAASAINATGQAVGSAAFGAGNYWHAFSWTAEGGIVDLGTLGGNNSEATAVNAAGQVVGHATITTADDYSNHAFSWTAAGGMIDLGTLGGPLSSARAVNSSGVVVGYAFRADGTVGAFSWTSAGGMVDLGDLGGNSGVASAINEVGAVVGNSTTPLNQTHAFLWTAEGGMIDLTADYCYGEAWGINASGAVVGHIQDCDGTNARGFFWSPSDGFVVLPTLGGAAGSVAQKHGINDDGVVVGQATSVDGYGHGFVWTATGGIVDLGTLGGGVWSSARGVNASGQVVGNAQVGPGYHAFLWSSTGGMTDLGSLGGSISEADAVSTAGVAGFSYLPGDQDMHAAFWPLAVSPPPDTTAPVVTVPAGVTAEATSPAGAVVTFAASATDPDDAAGPVTCSPASESPFTMGMTNVSCSATDTHGNTGTSTFTVTVVDTTPPSITAPANMTLAATGLAGATADFAATATDIASTPTIGYSHPPGSMFPIGTTTVTATATDGAGLSASATFTVTVTDVPPTIEGLISDVSALPVPSGIKRALTMTLRAAAAAMERGHVQSARMIVRAFILEVRALARSGRLPAEVAASMIADAQAVGATL